MHLSFSFTSPYWDQHSTLTARRLARTIIKKGAPMTLKTFFFPRFDYKTISIALLIIRLVAGYAMMQHGWGKIQTPMSWQGPESTTPGILQLLAAISEFGGGIAWMLGLLTPLASLGIAATMAVAVYTHAFVMGDPFVSSGGRAYELAAFYFITAVLLLLAGPGKFSLDELIRNRRRN